MTIKKKKSKHIVVIRICVKINLTIVKIKKSFVFFMPSISLILG